MRACLVDAAGIVRNTIVAGADYEPPVGLSLVVSEDGNIGDTYASGAFSPPPVPDVPLDDAKAAKRAALATRRWRAETAGITVAGIAVMTDRESQGLIVGAAVQAMLDAGYSVAWKTAGGSFVTLTAGQILAIAQGVRAHVQACFDHEATLTAAIDTAADAAALDAIDITTGWPG